MNDFGLRLLVLLSRTDFARLASFTTVGSHIGKDYA